MIMTVALKLDSFVSFVHLVAVAHYADWRENLNGEFKYDVKGKMNIISFRWLQTLNQDQAIVCRCISKKPPKLRYDLNWILRGL